MNSLLKYTTLLLAFAFVVGFTTDLSAKHYKHRSTSFSINFIDASRCLPIVPVREYHYVERRQPRYLPYYQEVVYPRSTYVREYYTRPIYERETIIVDPYDGWRY